MVLVYQYLQACVYSGPLKAMGCTEISVKNKKTKNTLPPKNVALLARDPKGWQTAKVKNHLPR